MAEISVIVPVYQAEAYLAQCVESILGQSFTDLELILVNDGSRDGSGGICDAYAARDSRVTVLHQENQGQAAARNRAIAVARGNWLCFVDSDDEIHPQMLELLYRAASAGDTGMSMCRMLEAPELPEDFKTPRTGAYVLRSMEEEALLESFDQYPGWVACGKLVRREIVEKKLFTPGRVYEDNEAVCHWILAAGQIAELPEKLYFYRTNPDSTTQRAFGLKRLDYLWALERIMIFYREQGYYRLARRFGDLYAEGAAGCYRRVRQELGMPRVARKIRRGVWRLVIRERIPLTKEQFEMMFDAMHPHLIRLYWPAEGCLRILREEGVGELMKKLGRQLRKGEDHDP